MKIMGIDEAGRGCVIGPMALGAVVVDEEGWDALIKIGVKDSKQLSPKKRQELFPKIQEIALFSEVKLVPPAMIDSYCHKNLLNLLEAEVAASLLVSTCVDILYIDAPTKNGTKFARQLKAVSLSSCNIIAENKADVNYPAVGAASIIAKVTRDKAILQLHQELGNFGSGYPADKKTIHFLKEFYKKNHCLPNCVRQSWSTIQRIVSGHQKKWEEILIPNQRST